MLQERCNGKTVTFEDMALAAIAQTMLMGQLHFEFAEVVGVQVWPKLSRSRLHERYMRSLLEALEVILLPLTV